MGSDDVILHVWDSFRCLINFCCRVGLRMSSATAASTGTKSRLVSCITPCQSLLLRTLLLKHGCLGADSKRALVSVSDKRGLDDLAKVNCN